MNTSREIHIQFISNHNGSSTSDIIYATFPAPLSVAFSSVMLSCILPVRYSELRYSSRLFLHLLVDSFTITLPILLSLTYLSNDTLMNLIYLLFAITSLMLVNVNRWTPNLRSMKTFLSVPLPEKKPPFLTNYRAGMNLATAICILAVDFQIFPRKFAKTETYGFGLMDVGVGSFVIAHGLGGSSHSSLLKTFKKLLPILILGFLRLFAVKLSNYHEHVTEYGVHWNFFFTLALVKGLAATIRVKTPPILISFTLMVVYEIILKLGLEGWILSNYPRETLFSANREGIFSLFGYLAIYYAAMQLGDYLKQPKKTLQDWTKLLVVLASISLSCWILLHLSVLLFGMASRRLANMSFCLWMLTYNSIMMAAYLLVDLFLLVLEIERETKDRSSESLPIFREPYLMQFINYNGLAFFLLANLLTGLVNMTFDTVQMHHATSIVTIFVYCFVLSGTAGVMYAWRWRI